MSQIQFFPSEKGSLRNRILTSVGAMILLSLLGSALSLYRMTEVNHLLEGMNHVYIPLGRLFAQIQSDAEVYQRELERGLGSTHWKEPRWSPKPVPQWIQKVLEHELKRAKALLSSESEWTNPESQERWNQWSTQILQRLDELDVQAGQLYLAISTRDEVQASELYPRWTASLDEWKRQLQWGVTEYERSLRSNFAATENRVADLRMNLELILVVVVVLSLFLLWLGEKALRPLVELTQLAREITRRGLRREDKSLLPEIPLSRADEVSQLSREFHRMATALIEREMTVENQQKRLQEQNRLLRGMGELNQNILNSIDSVLIVTDLQGRVTKCNPGALRWLGVEEDQLVGSEVSKWKPLQTVVGGCWEGALPHHEPAHLASPVRIGPATVQRRVWGGQLMPLREETGESNGAIWVLDDLTEEVDLQERLRQAENLAAVGRMSAQVAHEVRNPLHSIGLEAEMAIETAAQLGHSALQGSLRSILGSVDRLQKITDNYLKLTRLSGGHKSHLNFLEVLNSVLATYGPVCQNQGVQVEVQVEQGASLEIWADRDLFEQVLGNLMRNSLQALEENLEDAKPKTPRIRWVIGNAERGDLWVRVEDNGPGVSEEARAKLFTPFFTTRAQGTGLGLSFVKRVIEDHEGQIHWVADAGADPSTRGACFEIRLPIQEVSLNEANTLSR